MLQMYRIFINDKLLILRSSQSILRVDPLIEIQNYSSASSINIAINKLQNGFCKTLILQGDDLDLMWRDFCSRYELIEAAGGVVINSNAEVLWIRRNNKWDLPKGKVESGEKAENTAVREVQEECSVRGINRGELLGVTYHTYSYKGKEILKKSYWYAMSCVNEQNLIPQIEEGITEVIWADKDKHLTCMADTYTSITELLKQEKLQNYLDF